MKVSKILTIIGLLFVLSAFALTGYNFYDQFRAEQAAVETADRLREEIELLHEIIEDQKKEEIPDYLLDIPEEIRDQIVFDKEKDIEEDIEEEPEIVDMPTIELDGDKYIGIISLPSIGVELPVYAECSLDKLRTAPCAEYGSIFTDDLVICAHNYRGHFGKIGNIRIGDSIIITDVKGNEYRFTAAEKETLWSTEVEAMKNSIYPLTLYTCTLEGNRRITLRCNKSE